MKRYVILTLAAIITMAATGANAAEPLLKVSVLDNDVLCLQASDVPGNVKDQIPAATVPSHLAGTVLDLRFADDAATNAADYFVRKKSPLVVLVNGETKGEAARLAMQLRKDALAVLIGSTNSPVDLAPDILVAVSAEDEKKFQENPFLKPEFGPLKDVSGTNLLAFIDHTSEADLVRKRIKDGDEDGTVSTPRAEPPRPVIRDPALARATDLLRALAALHAARG